MTSRLRLLSALALIIILQCSLATRAQPPATLRFDNLGIADGLSQSSINSVLQDHLGFMWFCTDDGINRYDGYRFRIYRHERNNPHSPIASNASCIQEDSEGNMWVISTDGISRYIRATDDFQQLPLPEPMARAHFFTIETSGGASFFTSGNLLYRLDSRTTKLTGEPLPGCKDAFLLCSLPDGNLLLQDGPSILLYHPFTKKLRALACAFPIKELEYALPESAGIVWLAGNGQLIKYDVVAGTALKRLSLPNVHFTSAVFDAKGSFWAGSNEGLFFVDTASLGYRNFTSIASDPFSLAGKSVITLCRDRSGIIWIGTNDGGLSKLSYHKYKFGSLASSNGTTHGLSGKAAIALEEDGSGNIWIGTESGSITILNPVTKQLTRCDKTTGCRVRSDSYILSLFYADGIMYCGHDGGIDEISAASRKVIASPLIAENATIKKILRDDSGDLWAMGSRQLYKYNKAQRKFLQVGFPAQKGRLQNMQEDKQHRFWIGAGNGVLRYDPATGVTTDYSKKYPALFGSNITIALCRDMQGNVWFGTSEVGLLRYDIATDNFTLYKIPGLPNAYFYAMLCDDAGKIWVSTNAGVSRFDPGSLRITDFNSSDGLLSNEGIGRAAKRDSRGMLWFGNTGGLNDIAPAMIPSNVIPPQPRITSFKIFDKDIPFQGIPGGISLKQAENYFTIEYSAMDYTQPAKNSYRIMLEGFDKSWRPLTNANTVSYTNLDGGHYTFRLMAFNSDGVPSAKALELPIYILPHFYKTWWFYMLIAILVVGGAYSFYRYRINALTKELRLRTNIAADLHDDVGATLSSIKMLTTMLRPKLHTQAELSEMVNTIHQRAGTTLESMSDIVWSINPKNDAADNLVLRMKTYASEVLDDTDIAYRFVVAEGMDKLKMSQQKRKEIYLIFKEALINALKYADATAIGIIISRKGHRLELHIEDNGRGFDTEKPGTGTRGGNGLGNMKQRAAEIGGLLAIQSAAGKGTTVTLSVAIP